MERLIWHSDRSPSGDTRALYFFVIVLDYALRMAINEKEEELEFLLKRRNSRRIAPDVLTDFDFADESTLHYSMWISIRQAQELLQSVEKCVEKVDLKMGAGKTKCMSYNQHESVTIITNDGSILEEVGNFKYLGA